MPKRQKKLSSRGLKPRARNVRGTNPKKKEMFLGLPVELCEQQERYEEGEKHFCERSGVMCEIFDGAEFFEGVEKGDLQVYFCGSTLLFCGYKRHKISHLFDLLPQDVRINAVLAEIYHLFRSVAQMANDKEEQYREAGIIADPDELISVAIPLTLARRTRYALKEAYRLLQERDFPTSDPPMDEDIEVPTNFAYRHLSEVKQ